jgi:putative Mg2+ transporter-C (MgtC) family protein
MDPDLPTVATHLVAALVAGGVIGLERSFHGRPAGFRTHALVCLASSVLMLLTVSQRSWWTGLPPEAVRFDPTRVAQGIMTGIGFLGAGVIFKEGLFIRGLTTAASIWVTAAIGILIGVGFYRPALLATVLTLATLSVFRWIEARLPAHFYAQHVVRFDRDDVMPESELRAFLTRHGFQVANMSHRLSDGGATFEYGMVLRGTSFESLSRLADDLRRIESVRTFHISPTGD